MTNPSAPVGGPGRRPDASMSLLREIMDRPRDDEYAAAAQRRQKGSSDRSWFQEIIVLVLTIAIGVGGIWAARQLRTPLDSALEARSVLEEQIRDRSALTDALTADISELRGEIEGLRSAKNTPAEAARSREAERAAMYAGTIAVTGPGIEVVLTEPTRPGSDEEQVLDFDIQLLANSLWAAGAEAVSVNDRRLSFGTAIRTAGEVILVDLEPVQNPYRIFAIGDPDRLLRAFAETPGAAHLKVLNSTYRISSTITQNFHVEMAAGSGIKLNYAQPRGNTE